MDFKGVKCVINFDMPLTIAQYIHRIGTEYPLFLVLCFFGCAHCYFAGRTGRAGRPGEAVTFYTEADLDMLRTLAHVIRNSGQHVEEWMLNAPKLTSKKRKQASNFPIIVRRFRH
jgi:ATP-dependent RNA helicase DDX52/ROK1